MQLQGVVAPYSKQWGSSSPVVAPVFSSPQLFCIPWSVQRLMMITSLGPYGKPPKYWREFRTTSGREVAGVGNPGNQPWEIHGSPAMEWFNWEHHLYMLLVEPFASFCKDGPEREKNISPVNETCRHGKSSCCGKNPNGKPWFF